MTELDLGAIERDLDTRHFHQTSWDILGIPLDQSLVDRVAAAGQAPEYLRRPKHLEEGKRRQAFVKPPDDSKTEDYLMAAEELMDPVIGRLFSGDRYEQARMGWQWFNINYYDTNDEFPPHQDFTKPGEIPVPKPITVIVLSLSGIRRLTVENHEPIIQEPGSITLLNGQADPWHSAVCTEGPSMSVVADVYDMLRSDVEPPVVSN